MHPPRQRHAVIDDHPAEAAVEQDLERVLPGRQRAGSLEFERERAVAGDLPLGFPDPLAWPAIQDDSIASGTTTGGS